MIGDDATHAVAGLPGADGTETLVVALGRLRAAGATSFGAAFPVEGDPLGLGGPAAFNAEAMDVGEAVVVAGTGLGLVPERTGAAVIWTAHPAERRQLPDVGEADRELRATLLSRRTPWPGSTSPSWRPEVADQLMNLRHRRAGRRTRRRAPALRRARRPRILGDRHRRPRAR